MKRIACFTLDVEPDYGQDHIPDWYLAEKLLLDNPENLHSLFGSLDIRLTTFVVGKMIEEEPRIMDSLKLANAEIELHSFSHLMDRNRTTDVQHGLEVFEEVVGKIPLGYRAPQGAISPEEISVLDSNGVKFDSSVFPFVRLGRYSNFHVPTRPYLIENSSMIEYPMASIPFLRLPISLSYMLLVGWPAYRNFFRLLGLPNILVFDFHLHDLFPSRHFSKLPVYWQVLYSRIYRQKPLERLIEFARLLLDNGYEFAYMRELHELCSRRWNTDQGGMHDQV